MILLTPGPANTTQSVKEALVVDDVCHREQSFAELLDGIRRDLLRLAGGEDTHEVVLFTGSGSAAVDAAISSAVPPDGRLLLIVNGSYGVRMARMAEIYGVPFESMQIAWHERPDPAQVERRLAADGDFSHVAMVHHETSTGVLNPLDEVAQVCQGAGATLILDAISSFAGIPLDLRETEVGIMMVSANKCLQGMPGLSFVYARKELLDAMASYPPRAFYTALGLEYAAVKKSGQMRFTPASQVCFALRQALDETFEETLKGRFAR